MKKKKFVSIIVTTFNSRKFIIKVIKSILNQTYQNFEIIFVDDCSNDGTYEQLKKIKKKTRKKITLLKTNKNYGSPSVARNLGIKKAKGDLICLLDPDDRWEKDKLEIQANAFSNKNTIYTTAAKYFNSKNLKSGFLINTIRIFMQTFFINKINSEGFHWFYIYNPIITSSVLAHKSVFKRNFFDEDVSTREDIDLWIRLRKNNLKVYLSREISTSMFRRDDSLTSNFKKELVTLIRSLSNVYLKMNIFSKLNYFLVGIIIKFFLTFIKINQKFLKSVLKKISITLIGVYFVLFYSPLFWYLGKPLLHYDQIEKLNDSKNIVVFSGRGNTSYYNMTYQYRYKDIINISSNKNEIENIFIIGRLKDIPEQRIIEKLLISDGYDENKLQIIYEDFGNTSKNIKNISKILKDKKINEIIFITSPYHTKRAKLLWSKNTNIEVKVFKSINWPIKNSFFEYSKNKKIIIYEYASIIYNKLIGNI